MNRPRLLFLSHRLPFPPHGGAASRTFNILRRLEDVFDVHAVCFDRAGSVPVSTTVSERLTNLMTRGSAVAFGIPQQSSRIRLLSDHLKSVLRRRPYTWYTYDDRAFSNEVGRAVKIFKPDIVHVDSLDLVCHLGSLPLRVTALTHHNVESLLLRDRAKSYADPVRSAYVKYQSHLIAQVEHYWCRRVALNACVSDEDARTIRQVAHESRVLTVPNGVDIDFFRPEPSNGGGGLLFVGGTSWHPNRDALVWFSEEVLPRLRARGCSVPVLWVGQCTDAEKRRYSKEGLTLTGYVPDIRPYLRDADCFIAPIRLGGGTRLKMLDAWAAGKAIVSTTQGAAGLGSVHGEDVIVADSAEQFAASIEKVLQDRELRASLGRAGRARAVNDFSWTVIVQRLTASYLELVQGAGEAPSVEIA